jgi:integrase
VSSEIESTRSHLRVAACASSNADLRLQVMMTIACCLGLRPSEFPGLQWQDVDVSRGVFDGLPFEYRIAIDATKALDSEDESVLDADVLGSSADSNGSD